MTSSLLSPASSGRDCARQGAVQSENFPLIPGYSRLFPEKNMGEGWGPQIKFNSRSFAKFA